MRISPSRSYVTLPPLTEIHRLHLSGRYNQTMMDMGRKLHASGAVRIVEEAENNATLTVTSQNPGEKLVNRVVFWTERNTVTAECDCRKTQGDQRLICEHKFAAYYTLLERFKPRVIPPWERAVRGAIDQPEVDNRVKPSQLLVFVLSNSFHHYQIKPYSLPLVHFSNVDVWDVEAISRIALSKYVREASKEVTNRANLKRFANLTADAELALRTILMAEVAERYAFTRTSQPIDLLLRRLAAYPIFAASHPLFASPLRVDIEPATCELRIDEAGSTTRVTPILTHRGREYAVDGARMVEVIPGEHSWVQVDGKLFPLEDTSAVFTTLIAEANNLEIPEADRELFLREYLPRLAERTPVRGNSFETVAIDVDPVPRLYLTENQGELLIELRHAYEAHETPYDPRAPLTFVRRSADIGTLTIVRADAEIEKRFWDMLPRYGLKRTESPSRFTLRARVEPVDFLIHQIPRLTESGFEIYGDQDLKSIRVNRHRPRIDFSVSSGIDWLDVAGSVKFGDSEATFGELRRAIKRKERYVKLTDGSIGAIPEEWIARYRHLFSLAEESEGNLRLSNHHIVLLEEAIEGGADSLVADEEFERRRNRLRAFSRITARPLPAGLSGELRAYQKAGYDWLHFLHDYEFGGCLADDMGTGKTIQALAFLLSLKETGHPKAASLIVVPRSLLFNWEREAARFTPDLRVYMHSENSRVRKSNHFDHYDIVLTTYGVMLRDIEMLRRYRFHYVILDESQAIKNPFALTGRAARILAADHRLSLTGTPVENGTIELWSQFAFLNPGLLGTHEYFREEFTAAIERGRDEESADLLRKMVFPFILRRTKDQVATDLPPRTERIVYALMEPAQRALYEETRDRYRNDLLNLIDRDGMQNARMRMIEALLRLRQIANHPTLVDPGSEIPSGKFELLMETLETLAAEGHKALVFSQFVKMLRIVRTALEQAGMPYEYLDGSTRNRQGRVDAFQGRAGVPFFLISLKAGGVGLNLTAADYVIHIDPWWNPAVERQASDRTHRIGQDKPVFVYKLITRDTVEEKIVDLQERKRNLVDQIITTEQSFFKSLTPNDVEVLFT